MTIEELKPYLAPGRRIHLIGVGGVSMFPLAEVLRGQGVQITGSDVRESANVRHLEEEGVTVFLGHFPENVNGADAVIRTAAVHDDNPEIVSAHAQGIPVFERAQAWGAIMTDYKHALCISGTHGKTTVTSMATHIAMAANIDPTVMIGGNLPLLGKGYRVGQGDTIILESCEYCNSFLSFRPTIAVILDIEADHLDFFKDLADVEHSFQIFANLVPEDGGVIANADDRNTMDTLEDLDKPMMTFGLGSYADVYCDNLVYNRGVGEFDLMQGGSFVVHITLSVPGLHNVKNALAAAASALAMGISPTAIAAGLRSFHGAERRFEYKGEYHGAKIYDDYAHHPGELHMLLETAKTLGYDRVICAFQPHTYSRTKALFPEFVEELSNADITILTDIYAAREVNTLGVSSKDLAAAIPHGEYYPTFDGVEARLKELARPGDLILTVGAGELYQVAERLAAAGEAEQEAAEV
ncbi:MAG: UDP-N-acetylmuramate--L-alanine ligase [Clostridiales bacterium]|nr:UDP-N-acetylmuramate--L-alanine ligase [Clostridiales bacterium]